MASSTPTTVTATLLTGGLFDDERTKLFAKRVMFFASATCVLYTITVIVSLTSPENLALYDNDVDRFEGSLDEKQIDALRKGNNAVTIIPGAIIGLLCFGGVMLVGYCGAKNKERTNIAVFSCCSVLCGVCGLAGVICLLTSASIGSTLSCSVVEDSGLNPAACYANVVMGIILVVCYFINAWYSYQLYSASEVVVAYPAVAIQTAPTTVQAKPVAQTGNAYAFPVQKA